MRVRRLPARWSALLAVLGGVLVLTAAPLRAAEPTTGTTQQFADVLRSLQGQQFEITFLPEMISHHQGAVEMAKMQLERGQHPELKALSGTIIASQQREIGQMTGWLRQWYEMTPQQAMETAPPRARQLMGQLEVEMRPMMQEVESARTPAAVDRAFLRNMIMHHQQAIVEARPVRTNAPHAELRQLAQQIITIQGREIVQMNAWLQAWYGETAGTMGGGKLANTASQLPLLASTGVLLVLLTGAGLLLTRRQA